MSNRPTIPELESLIQSMKEEQANADRLAWSNFQPVYDWHIRWTSPHVFYCYRRLSDDSRSEIDVLRKSHPSSVPYWAANRESNEGMTYLLIGNYLARVGGGTLILKATPPDVFDQFSHEPRYITDEERDALRRSIVPKSLQIERR